MLRPASCGALMAVAVAVAYLTAVSLPSASVEETNVKSTLVGENCMVNVILLPRASGAQI